MRRTAAIRLTLLSAASLALVSCGEDATESDTMFAHEAACMAAYGDDGRRACAEAFSSARADHQVTAPRFPTQSTCETETGGNCEMAGKPGAPSYAIPVLAGVLIGRALAGGGGRAVMPLYAGGAPMTPGCAPGSMAPECRQSSNTSSSSSSSGGRGAHWHYAGNHVGSTAGAAGDRRSFTASPTGTQAMTRMASTPTVSRGGLGAAGRSFSSVSS